MHKYVKQFVDNQIDDPNCRFSYLHVTWYVLANNSMSIGLVDIISKYNNREQSESNVFIPMEVGGT